MTIGKAHLSLHEQSFFFFLSAHMEVTQYAVVLPWKLSMLINPDTTFAKGLPSQ